MSTLEFLQGELERLFELDTMMALSADLLGLDPSEVGGTGAKGTFARALVRHCEQHLGLSALEDAIRYSARHSELPPAREPGPEEDVELSPGAEVGGFRVLKRLGEGPLAVVYLAERPAPNNGHTERAAVKVFHRRSTADRASAYRLLTAARLCKKVQNTGLANVYEAGRLPDGRIFIASEYIPGQSLAERVRRGGALPVSEVHAIARTLLKGLAALHAEGLLHGHLKAENLFLVRPPAPPGAEPGDPMGVLTDLGTGRLLAGSEPSLPGVLRLHGDPSTMAPEVARGAAPDARSEVYAVGCLLYLALTGKPVFEASTPIEQIAAHLYEEPTPLAEQSAQSWMTPELEAVVLRALSKEPSERYASAEELAAALEEVAHAVPEEQAPELDMQALLEAIASFQASPRDASLAAQLEALVAPSKSWQHVVDVFLEAADAVDDETVKRQLLFRTARILADEQGDREAAERVYRVVLEYEPSDAQAHDAIEELRRARGDHEGLVGLLLDRLEIETEAETRGRILREVATLYEEALEAPENAFVAWTQALTEDPSEARAVRAVERLAQTPEQWSEAISAVQDAIENSEPQHALSLCLTLAQWYGKRLARPDLALSVLNRALQIDPAHEPALEALTALYRDAQSWSELVQILLHRAESTANPARARDLRAEAAGVLHHKLGDLASAAQLFETVFADDPTHPGALSALEEIYRSEQAWTKLVELLAQKAKEQRGSQRAETLCELGLLCEQTLSDFDRALTHYAEAVSADEKCLEALRGMERCYIEQGAVDELLANMEQQLALATTPSQRIELLERMGTLYEDPVGDPPRAVEKYEQIIELSPSHEGANTALARLYRELHRFEDLAQTYDRHAKGVEDPARKAELLMQAARVLMADLGSPDRAAFVCERVLAIEPGHTEALSLTARIRALAGDSVAALDALEVLADTEQDAAKRAEIWVRAGQMLEQQDNLDGAVERYLQALEAVPGHALALEALERLYERRGDTRGQAELLLRKVELAEDADTRAARLVELGRFRREQLKDKALAADAFERARELDPQNLEALIGLGELAYERKEYETATELLEPVLEHLTELPREVALRLCLSLGDAYRALEQLGNAERAYLQAKALSPEDRDVLERLAEVAILGDKHEDAVNALSMLLDRYTNKLSPIERGEALLKLGRAQVGMSDLSAAAVAFSQASELLLDAPEPLDALYEVQEQKGNWDAAARTLRRRIDLARDDEERFALWVRAGDVYANHLRDRDKAGKAYVTALELNAGDRNLLSKLMALYSQAKDWSRLLEVLVRMADVVDETTLRGKYYNTAAAIAHQELSALDQAIELYEKALVQDPTLESAFRGLSDCFQRTSNWDRLANLYRAHIERNRGQLPDAEAAALWDNLGELYQYRLSRIDQAVAAYEAAQELDPDNRTRIERLVEIYSKYPNRYADRAIAAHAELLEQQPYRIESYRALRKLYTQLSRADEAWCLCQTLRSLNMAEPEEEAFFKRHRVQAPATARECITEQLWEELLLSPEQDPLLTALFAAMQPAAVAELAQEPEAFGIDRQAPVDCETDQAVMAQMLYYASGVTLVPLPPVFYQPGSAGGVSFLFTNPPSIGLGQAAFQPAPDQALAFIAGRQLSYMRPGHYMRQLVPTGSGLRAWLLAALRLANPRFPVPDPMREQVERNHQALQRGLNVAAQQALTSLVDQLLREEPELDMKRWALGVDLTADRVGFVLANSLDAATAVVRASPPGSSFASERERLKALYLYSVSPRYLALRQAIGVTIG